MTRRVHLASDHAGFELKSVLTQHLAARGFAVVDHGAVAFDPDDDYPGYCAAAAAAVVSDPGSLGVVIGGSGNGEQIAANKVRGVRAALAYNTVMARLGREHNNANVLSLGGRGQSHDEALAMVKAFVTTSFPGEERHVRRLAMLEAYEARHPAP